MRAYLTTLAVLSLMLINSIAYGNPEMIKQIGPGVSSSLDIYNIDMAYLNGYYYFSANDGNGNDLWRTDGTFEGTEKVCEVNSNNQQDAVRKITVVGNTIYFYGLTSTYGWEPWISNGNIGNGTMLKDINPGSGSSWPVSVDAVYFQQMGSYVYFKAAYKTVKCKLITGGNQFMQCPIGELYKTDGTSAGTVKVKDICSSCRYGSDPWNITILDNKLYFDADASKKGRELWQSDGTSAGTVMVKDINPGSASSSPDCITLMINDANLSHLYFEANDGTGGALWKSNGTASGTIKIKSGIDIALNRILGNIGWKMLVYDYKLFFINIESTQRELWVSDGTTNGTTVFYDIGGPGFNGNPDHIEVFADKMYFAADHPDYGREFWIYDFSAQTFTTIDINPGANNSNPNQSANLGFAELGDYVYFFADGGNGYELWRINKETYGYEELTDFVPANPIIRHFAVLDGKLIFSANDGENGQELWIYDPNDPSPRQTSFDFFGNESNTKLSVKPNPAHDVLNISADFGERQNVELTISDVIGNQVISLNRTATSSINEQLNISGLSPGVYFIRLKLNTDVIIRKIVKN